MVVMFVLLWREFVRARRRLRSRRLPKQSYRLPLRWRMRMLSRRGFTMARVQKRLRLANP